MPRFSIIVPVYNAEEYLDTCVASVLAQSFPDHELILVDDGSTDLSGSVCDAIKANHADRKITVIHQSNQGQLAARQAGFSTATGEFILFLDSDDYWESDILEVVHDLIVTSNCDLVLFRARMVSPSGEFVKEYDSLFPDRTVFTDVNRDQAIHQFLSGRLKSIRVGAMHRSLITLFSTEEYGRMRRHEDMLQFMPVVFDARRIVYTNRILYNYRYNPNGITYTGRADIVGDMILVRKAILAWLHRKGYDNQENLNAYYRSSLTQLLGTSWEMYINRTCRKNMIGQMERINRTTLFQEARKYFRASEFSWQVCIVYRLLTWHMPLLIYFCMWLESCRRRIMGRGD